MDRAGPYSLDVLAATPIPNFFVRDAETLKAKYVAWFEQASGRTLYPAQVEMLLIETLSYAMSVLGQQAQMVAEQHLVATAGEAGLELLSINRSTPRLKASPASVRLRFVRVPGVAGPLLIPVKTRVVAGQIYFETDVVAALGDDQDQVDVDATASITGVVGNGFLPGQITALAESSGVVSVINISPSEGGSDIEGLEPWRLRIANAFERISTGGSHAWYRETAMAVSPAVIDVAVIRPQPCFVDLYPLTPVGAPSAAMLADVAAIFNTRKHLDIRFGDEVTVKLPVAVTAAVTLTLVTGYGLMSSIVADAQAAARDVLSPWRQRLGAQVAPSDVATAVSNLPGVIDVQVAGLSFMALQPHEFLVVTEVHIVVVPT